MTIWKVKEQVTLRGICPQNFCFEMRKKNHEEKCVIVKTFDIVNLPYPKSLHSFLSSYRRKVKEENPKNIYK